MAQTFFKKLISYTLRVAVVVVGLLFLLFMILQIPSVQQYITSTIVNRAVQKTSLTVKIGGTSFNLNRGVSLDGVVGLGIDQDTLLVINEINVSPRGTLISLVTGGLALNQISLSGLDIRLKRSAGDNEFNWQKTLASQSTSPKDSSSGQAIELQFLGLRNVSVTFDDELKGQHIEANMKGLDISINELDLGDSINIDIKSLIMDEPYIRMVSSKITPSAEPLATDGADAVTTSLKMATFGIVNGNFITTDVNNKTLKLEEIDLLLTEMVVEDFDHWDTRLEDLAFVRGKDNFKYMSAQSLKRSGDALNIDQLQINLNKAVLKLDAEIQNISNVSDWKKINAKVKVAPSRISINDLKYLIPSLSKEFGKEPILREELQLEGSFVLDDGKIDARDVLMWLGGRHKFLGGFAFESAEDFSSSLLTANVQQLNANVPALNALSSKINLPAELVRLGNIDFAGSYDGYVNDFVATGALASDLGDAFVDIQFDLSGDNDEAISYQGSLKLDSFDLARFTLNEDFGYAFAQIDITDGVGPDLSNSSANIKAVIPTIDYKGYIYKNAVYSGNLSSKIVNGTFEIKDDDVDFSFSGIVDVSDSIPVFDFNIIAEYINFCNLNIVDFPCEVSFASDISFKGSNVNNVEGRGIIGDISLKSDSTSLAVKNIEIIAAQRQKGSSLRVSSDFLDFEIDGVFDLVQVADATINQILKNTALHNDTWKVGREVKDYDTQDYKYSVSIKDATPVFEFLSQDIEQVGVANLVGEYNSQASMVKLNGVIPYLRYKEWSANDITIDIGSRDAIADLLINMSDVTNGSLKLESAYVANNIFQDEMEWTIYGRSDSVDVVSLSGKSRAVSEGYYTEFIEHDIVLDSVQWKILPNDGFGIFPGRLDIAGVTMTDGDKYVKISDYNNRGLAVSLKDFDLSLINPLINYEPLYFEGAVDGEFVVNDLYKDKSIQGFLQVDSFTINQDPFGTLLVETSRASDGVVDLNLSIIKGEQQLLAKGHADIENSFIDFNVDIQKYPMAFFEYIIEEGISQTEGTTDIDVQVKGNLDDLKMKGTGIMNDVGVRIDYIGGFYRMDQQTVQLDESFIDFTDVILIDEMGNTAQIEGGLRHNLLADIRADLRISSSEFVGLNTTEDDNPLYYGLGVGALDISFSGPFDVVDIRLTAILGNPSTIYVPITNTEFGYDQSFIVYDYNKDGVDSIGAETLVESLKRQGVDFEMNLSFTSDAQVQIIYDQETNNILKGSGQGSIRLRAKRDGEFTVYGDYNVESGSYLYTGYGAIAKPFDIQPGGTVIWTGDPINASINVSAKYPVLRVPLREFLQEYNGFGGIPESEFNQRREVDLTLLIDGTLFTPDINFDINFPNLIGPIRPLALSKVRALRSTENALNNQVVGLMVFGNFLPDNNPLAEINGERLGQTGTSTVTQFITSQLSLLFSEYLSNKLSEDGLITGIDFDIALANNNSFVGGNGNVLAGLFDVVPDEVQLNLRNRFRNDNLVLNVGGNYVRSSQIGTRQDFVTGDFSLDWFLTKDKRLKVQFYGNFDYDESRVAGRQRYGIGINYRKEFGTITNFETVMDDLIEDIRNDPAYRESPN